MNEEEKTDKKMTKILDSGRCKCVYEPRGDYGLEGYQINEFYNFERKENYISAQYFRVYPDKNFPYYGENCTVRAFSKFFKITGQS